jgi:hypothetical protein
MEVVSRRFELLRLDGLCFSQAEIVNELSQKFACAKSTIYNDFETRASWQPILQSINNADDVLLKVVNRYEQIYRQASRRLITSPNPLVQLGALNIMLKANSLMYDTAVLPSIVCRLRALEQKAARGVFVP